MINSIFIQSFAPFLFSCFRNKNGFYVVTSLAYPKIGSAKGHSIDEGLDILITRIKLTF